MNYRSGVTETKERYHPSRLVAAVVFWVVALILLVAGLGYSRGMTDFRSYYVAGELVRFNPQNLYSVAEQLKGQLEVGPGTFFPWAHLPPEALLVAPLTLWPFHIAFTVWKLFSLSLLAVVGYLLRAYLKGYSAIALVICPVVIGLSAGQDHILTLIVFVLAFLSLKEGNEFTAGCILGLGLMRFEITVPLLLFFLVARRWRVIVGSALVGSLLVAGSFVIVGRSFIPQYVGMCKFLAAAHNSPEAARMATVRGFLTAIFPHQPHLAVAVIALSIVILIWGLCLWIPWKSDPAALDRLFPLALVISLLIDYHGFIYNMTSLVLPGLLLLQRHPKASILLWISAAATFWITFAARGHGEFGLLAPLFLAIAIWTARRNPSELIAEQTMSPRLN